MKTTQVTATVEDIDYDKREVKLKDSDGDCFPDVIDPAPTIPGFLDGIHNPKNVWHAQLRP